MASAVVRRLWVVDPSLSCAEDQGVTEILWGWPGSFRVFRPCLDPEDRLESEVGYETDGVVVMGSAASVYEDQPWMDRLAQWLHPVLRGEVVLPVLGICFGHQLIAHLAGSRVGFNSVDRAKSIGVATSRLDGGRLLPGAHALRVVISHREQVETVPAGYRVVASRTGTPIDGMEHERLPVFSFQFHPEARDQFAKRAGLAPSSIDDRVRGDSRKLLGAFRDLCRHP